MRWVIDAGVATSLLTCTILVVASAALKWTASRSSFDADVIVEGFAREQLKVDPPAPGTTTVVLVFSASWCGPCRRQAEIVDSWEHRADLQDIEFRRVDVDKVPGPIVRVLPTLAAVDPQSVNKTVISEGLTASFAEVVGDGRH